MQPPSKSRMFKANLSSKKPTVALPHPPNQEESKLDNLTHEDPDDDNWTVMTKEGELIPVLFH